MASLKVVNAQKMKSILQVFSKLDEIRWKDASNYNLINYYRGDTTFDERLLTHWLCYITDRQMRFQRIWDIGGYVVSHLVHNYTHKRQQSVCKILISYIRTEKEKMRLVCPVEEENSRLMLYDITGDEASFASRYMPEDLALMYRTLEILSKLSERSFCRFLSSAIDEEKEQIQAVKETAAALDQLTYSSAGAVPFAGFKGKIKEIEKEIACFQLELGTDEELFSRKRLWCALRDYLKSPELNN